MAHPSASVPSYSVPSSERIDIAMKITNVVKNKTAPFNMGHLSSLMCGNENIFQSTTAPNYFFNALRLRWKLEGRMLDTQQKIKEDLVNFLTTEYEGLCIVADLLTVTAVDHLITNPSALDILAMIVFDLYKDQWSHWTATNAKKLSHDHLVLAHAQNTTNQLSNFVLAFKNAKSELKAWAEKAAAFHVATIVTSGHMPIAIRRPNAVIHQARATLTPTRSPYQATIHPKARSTPLSSKRSALGAPSAAPAPSNKRLRGTPDRGPDSYRAPYLTTNRPRAPGSMDPHRNNTTTSPYFEPRRSSIMPGGTSIVNTGFGARAIPFKMPVAPIAHVTLPTYQLPGEINMPDATTASIKAETQPSGEKVATASCQDNHPKPATQAVDTPSLNSTFATGSSAAIGMTTIKSEDPDEVTAMGGSEEGEIHG